MTHSKTKEESAKNKTVDTDKGESEETTLEDDEEEEEDDSGNDEDFLSEELNLPVTEEDDEEEEEEEEETDSVPDYPVIMDDSEEDRIFKRQLSYPPIPMYHPPIAALSGGGGHHNRQRNNMQTHSNSSSSKSGRMTNPRDKIGMLTPMEEVTEPPSSAATSIDGDHRCRSRNNRRAAAGTGRNSNYRNLHPQPRLNLSPPSPTPFPQQPPPLVNSIEQKSILKSQENLQNGGHRRSVTFEGGSEPLNFISSVTPMPRRRSPSPPESLASNTSEYSSMADSGRRTQASTTHHHNNNDIVAKREIQRTITEETEETEQDPDYNSENNHTSNGNSSEPAYQPPLPSQNHQAKTSPPYSFGKANTSPQGNGAPTQKRNSTDLGLISDMEQGEKVIQWQMENAKSESGSGSSTEGNGLNLDSEFPSIVNGIIAELHNLDELIGSSSYGGVMEMNASKQDHLANVSTQLATYLAQVSPQTVMTNLPQVIPLVTSLLYLTGSNFRSQLASLTAVNVFIERLRDCKAHSGLRVLPQADLTWLVRALCEISSESSRSVLKNEGVLALARLIKTAGPEMVFDPILFILMGNDEKVRKRRSKEDDEDRIVIPTGGPGGAPKIKATALDSLTFALLTFPRDDFNLDLVAKLACHCLLHPKRRMRQASLECLAVISHALGSHVALPMFRQVIVEELAEARRKTEVEQSSSSISSEASVSGSAPGSCTSEAEADSEPPPKPSLPSKIPVRLSNTNEGPEDDVSANPISLQKLKPKGSPISAISARISRHLLPQPSLHDLVEYAVKIPASSRVLSRQNLIVSKQEELGSGSGGESVESGSGGSANVTMGRSRIASSSGTSCSSVTNVEIELEPVLNAIGSGRRKQINEVAGSVMAADVAWILNGSGPIKTCETTSVLAPIYRQAEQQLLVSDMNLTSTHLRQLGMIHSYSMDSDSNVSESFNQKLSEQIRRGSLRGNGNGNGNSSSPSNTLGQLKAKNNNNGQSNSNTDPASMTRFYYGGNNGNGSGGGGGGGSLGRGGMGPPSDNNNGSRISSNTSYSLLPNKYSLIGNGGSGVGGGLGGGSLGMRGGRGSMDVGNSNIMQMNGGEPMLSPHHVPNSTYDYTHYGSSMDGIDGYGSGGGGAINSTDLYNDPPPSSLRASSRVNKMGAMPMPMQPVHSLRQKYFDSAVSSLPRGGTLKGNYSDEDEEDVGIVNHGGSESSAVSSDEEDEIHATALKQQEALMKERRASQVSLKSASQTGNKKNIRKSSKSGKTSKTSKKSGKEGKSAAGNTTTNASGEQPDKVEQIVSRLAQEYQVFRVDRVELDQTGPSPEELAAAKKKRGELDSAGSNSRDSGVSIGAGSVGSAVHTPAGGESQQTQQQASVSPEDEENSASTNQNEISNSTSSNGNSNGGGSGSGGKKEGSNKRKSSLKTGKKSGHTKVVQHAVDTEDGLSRNWKSTPDVASIMDDYEPRMTNYRKNSISDHAGHNNNDIIGNGGGSPYHSTSALASANGENNYMSTLHRKPVLAGGRRQSLGLGRPPAVDLGELEDRQLALIPQQEGGRASRIEYHQQQQQNNNNVNKHSNHLHSSHSHLQHNGYGGGGYNQPGGFSNHLHEPDPYNPHNHNHHHPRHANSMLDIDKAPPSRESSAGSGNTYSLLHHDAPPPNLHPHYSLSTSSSHNLRSSKSTGNLLGVGVGGGGVDDPYRQPIRGGGVSVGGGGSYFDVMEHPGSPGRRMLHSRLANHHALVDLGNSTDDMEFPMTPQSESSSNTLPKQSRGMITGRMNSKVVPKKIYKGSFREVNARGKGGVLGSINAELFPPDLKPVSSPKHALPAALLQVQASDWETNVDGFRQLVRLARHHPEFIRSDLHNVNMNALRHVQNLRSQVCRAAILFFRELFQNVGKAMEHDSERISEKLLDKAADTNKFIREDSGKALEALVLGVSPAKALTCLDLYGTRHRNPAVRSMTARMTTKLIDKLGADRSLSEVPERLLPMLCRFLQEGSLDTRMSAKLAFSVLMESPSFDTQLKRHVPADTLRHVQKAMKAITTKS